MRNLIVSLQGIKIAMIENRNYEVVFNSAKKETNHFAICITSR